MSFGQAAGRGGRPGFAVVRGEEPCPCGSGLRFDACCRPLHEGAAATTAESLMRSRYSAFVVGNEDHVAGTWHPGTRPPSIDLDARLRWTGLTIVATTGGGAGDRRGTVEFRASWRDGADRGVLHETSRFVFQSDRWWYLDGDVR
ncbi:YchJ family metal-binding protein [Microbacterium sp. AZCO]|uniref:YchJ family protein n=1 Tax=Microbacterium sp. AZCO TaxID=3142976 RepID=UPI0031F38EAF